MLLHLFDDEKVVNRCIGMFEKALPNQNIYVCIADVNKLKHVKQNGNVYFHKDGDTFDKEILSKVDAVLIHFLNYQKIQFVQNYVQKNCPCYWIVWGADLYSQLLYFKNYPLIYKSSFLHYKKRILKFLHKLGYRGRTYETIINFIKERINYIVSSVDYDLINSYLGKHIGEKVQVEGFEYYPLETVLGEFINCSVVSNDIIIGNSASLSNNHLYAFDYLSKLDIGKRKVITPINYAGTSEYKSYVIHHGKKSFGENYTPLLDFLPLPEYNRLMTRANVFIFANWRQEAWGNVVVALYQGAKVFISKKSPLNHYLRKKNFVIFDLEDITQKDIDSNLEKKEIENNRVLLKQIMAESVIINNIKNIWG